MNQSQFSDEPSEFGIAKKTAFCFTGLAFLTLLASVLLIGTGIWYLTEGPVSDEDFGTMLLIAGLVGLGPGVLTNLAFSEGLRILLAIEQNTRKGHRQWKAISRTLLTIEENTRDRTDLRR